MDSAGLGLRSGLDGALHDNGSGGVAGLAPGNRTSAPGAAGGP